jgi:two-component system nitrate/nitrite response regulator NarL
VLSIHNNREYIFRIIQAGAHGYVSKEAAPEELMKAIVSVYDGEPFFSPEIARAALNQIVSSGGKKEPFAQLTGREREVLILIAEGQSNKEIASKLGIGVRTIETHRERIMRRLDIHSVAGLTKFAIAHGMISLDGERMA